MSSVFETASGHKVHYRLWRKKPRLEKRPLLVRKEPKRPSRRRDYGLFSTSELDRMLAGKKQMAMFYETAPFDGGFIPEYRFAPHVAAGRMVRREVFGPARKGFGLPSRARSRSVYYAMRGQEWRIDMALLVDEVYMRRRYRPGLERVLGRLLGYSKESTEDFLGRLGLVRRPRKKQAVA